MSDLWITRHEAEEALRGTLQEEAVLLEKGFHIIDSCSKKLSGIDSSFARVCGGVLAKGRNLLLACYSLSLDGLAQEGGAVLRPLIEAIEMLEYFSQDTSRVEHMLQGKKPPKAGEIASKIGSSYQRLRNYLNDYASHMGIDFESMYHLFDIETGSWRTTQRHNNIVLRKNMEMTWAVSFMLVVGATRCLDAEAALSEDIANTIEEWRHAAISIFSLPWEA